MMSATMNATDGSTSAGATMGARFADLAAALDEEAEIVNDLYDTLLRQRAGVAADDGNLVEASVTAVSRLLLTLHEARRRRSGLLETISGDAHLALEELERVIGGDLPQPLEEARTSLRRSARDVAREVAINRAVLGRAVESGEAFLQELFATVQGPSPVYSASERRDERDSGAGLLFDRKG